MKKLIISLCVFLTAACFAVAGQKTPSVAVFTRNASGDAALEKYRAPLEAAVCAKLGAQGFKPLSKDVIILELSKISADKASKNSAEAAKLLSGAEASANAASIFDNASMLRVAQLLGADYVLDVSLSSLAVEKRAYEGDGTKTLLTRKVLRCAYSIYEGGSGRGVGGETVKSDASTRQSGNLQIDDADTFNELVDSSAAQIAASLSKSRETLAAPEAAQTYVVRINCFVEDMRFPTVVKNDKGEYIVGEHTVPVKAGSVGVIIDGVLLGNAASGAQSGEMVLASGIHQLRIERADLEPYERMINVGPNLRELSIYLRMSDSARARWKSDSAFFETLKAGAKLADAEVKRIEGIAKMYENSGYKVDYKTDTNLPITIQNSLLP